MSAPEQGAPNEAPPEIATAASSARWARLRDAFARSYLTIDPRSLGLGRIVLGLLLLFDLYHRARGGIELWYSNQGLLPNHTYLWRPPTQWMFSLFFMASWPDEATVGFILCGLVYVGLLVGWRTRLMQVLSVIAVMSLHSRTTFLENGGDWTMGELALWTSFLPLGVRFSIDSLRASLRRRRETTAAHLNDRAGLEGVMTPVVSLAVLAVVLQLADTYFFNCVHKGGQTWKTGSAVHYTLYQDRMVTWFGVWMRPHMTLALSRVLSWGSLATEAVLPVLLLAPVGQPRTRTFAIPLILGLHLGFQTFLNLGCFSWTMMSFTPYLISTQAWDWLARRATRVPRRVTVYFDAGCGVCFQIARVLARMDRLGRLRFVSNADVNDLPEGVTTDLLTKTIVVVDERTRSLTTRADGMATILRALPVGWLWSFPLRLPGLRQLANVTYDAFARRRTAVSVWLGLAACEAPAAGGGVGGPSRSGEAGVLAAAPPRLVPEPEPTPFRQGLRRGISGIRELSVLLLIATLVSETLYINQAVPKFLKHKQPTLIMELVAYPRLIQAWSMFAADAPMTDENVVVDAITVDGRHVDPYSEVSGRYKNPGHDLIPPRLDNDSFFFNYSSRIPFKGEYWTAFQEWVLRYPERTGNPADTIKSFDAWIVEDDSPPPGQTVETNRHSRIWLSWPKK
jgi:predicted DCC family thiol-disulfide oxidoreductase YuxK